MISKTTRPVALSLLLLASGFVTVALLPERVSAGIVAQDTTDPVEFWTTPTGAYDDDSAPPINDVREPLKDGAGAKVKLVTTNDLIAWTANLSKTVIHFDGGYTSDVEELAWKATLFYTTDGSAPLKGTTKTKSQELFADDMRGDDNQAPSNSSTGSRLTRSYYGSIQAANLADGNSVRFMVEVYARPITRDADPATPKGPPIGCDLGRPLTGTVARIINGACPTTGDGHGFKLSLDNTKPAVTSSLLAGPGASQSKFGDKTVTNKNGIGFNVSIQDSSVTTTTAFATQIDFSKTILSVRDGTTITGGIEYLRWDQGDTRSQNHHFAIEGHAWGRTYTLNPGEFTWPVNKELRLFVQSQDHAANPAKLPPVLPRFYVDTAAPSITELSATVTPSRTEQQGDPPRQVVVTGVGAIAKVTVRATDGPTSAENHLNQTATNKTAVTVFFLSKNDQGDIIFQTPPTGLPAKGSGKWEGDVLLYSPTAPLQQFAVELRATALDAGGNTANRTALMPFQVKPGAPVVNATGPVSPIPGYVGKGPYAVRATATDPDGVNATAAVLVIHNATGAFTSLTGWTKRDASTWEKAMTKSGNEYTGSIPDAKDGTTIVFHVEAKDAIGNLGLSINQTLLVDQSGPTVGEANPLTHRGPATKSFQFTAFDASPGTGVVGTGVNTTSGLLHYRAGTSGAFESIPMQHSDGVLNATIPSLPADGTTIQYYAAVKDRLGNVGTNGSQAAPHSFIVDSTPPTTTLQSPPPTSTTGDFSLTAVASDSGSGIRNYVFEARARVGTQSFGDWFEVSNTTQADSGDLCLGAGSTYEFRAYAVDRAGNKGLPSGTKTSTVTSPGCEQGFTVDVLAPERGNILDAEKGIGTTTIRWVARANGTVSAQPTLIVDIDFSPDGGRSFFPVVADHENTGAFLWALEIPSCNDCRIRVTAGPPGTTGIAALSDPFRIINGVDTADYDENGIPDACELAAYGRVGVDPGSDDDEDGLSTKDECAEGTDPLVTDSDADGVSDGIEVKLGRDALDANDVPSEREQRFAQWDTYFFILPALFVLIAAVFFVGLTRRW